MTHCMGVIPVWKWALMGWMPRLTTAVSIWAIRTARQSVISVAGVPEAACIARPASPGSWFVAAALGVPDAMYAGVVGVEVWAMGVVRAVKRGCGKAHSMLGL